MPVCATNHQIVKPTSASKATVDPGEESFFRTTFVDKLIEESHTTLFCYYLCGLAPRFTTGQNPASSSPVSNAFQILGIEPALILSDDALRESFREAGKLAHPDAGGGEGDFAALREAFAVVSSPSRRLRHWLEWRGTPGEVRGTIDNSLMDLFSGVGGVTQQAEALIRKRDEAKSALVRAMLEAETQVCREAVERAISQVESRITRECEAFSGFEQSADLDVEAASKAARNLAFLEKWRAGLRACFSRLV